MVCIWQCGLAAGFVGASLLITIGTYHTLLKDKLVSLLNDQEKQAYFNNVNERFRLYAFGLFLGLIISTIYIYFMGGNDSNASRICAVISIVMTVCYFTYTVAPKSPLLVQRLERPEQREAWVQMYKYMQGRFHGGFLLGLIGYGLLCAGGF